LAAIDYVPSVFYRMMWLYDSRSDQDELLVSTYLVVRPKENCTVSDRV
jgi:hypothetical protein